MSVCCWPMTPIKSEIRDRQHTHKLLPLHAVVVAACHISLSSFIDGNFCTTVELWQTESVSDATNFDCHLALQQPSFIQGTTYALALCVYLTLTHKGNSRVRE